MYLKKCAPTETPSDIDIPALRAKYRQERDKRMRTDGTKQYIEITSDQAEYYESDPYATPVDRDPISDEIDVAILGGGFAGLIAAAELKKLGVNDVRIIEFGGDFGGTWYWNRYPGVQCDVEAYTYLPLLEETNYIPKERYSYGPEIYEHCQRIGRHYDLYKHALFSTLVRGLRWDESIKRWHVTTDKGDDIRARFVVMGAGVLNKPKLPGIPGITSFKGHTFHTARWDYDYTGGDTTGGLTKLGDKRVAIIGTGATAIQCISHLGRHAKHLYVFQRTPSSCDARGNRPTDPEWVKSLKPGWQLKRQADFHRGTFEGLSTPDADGICDSWSEINRNTAARINAMGNPTLTPEQHMAIREEEEYRVMERLRRRVDSIVTDKDTAEKLKPYYRFMCKRPCFNDDYLPTFNRPNVTLVDVSSSKGVERITEKGIVANGVEYEVDCIVYASGFEVTTDLKRRFGIDFIQGRNGQSLYDYWADGFQTLHGITTHGFPNQFFTGFFQNAVSAAHNLMYSQQGGHIAYIIKEAIARGEATVEPSKAGQDAWVKTIRETLVSDPQFSEDCTPGYYNNEGKPLTRSPLFGEPYGPGYWAFEQLLQSWRDKGNLEGMQFGK
jgi:cyclohexanone monooxygenase